MSKKGKGQAAVTLLSNGLGAALLDLIANGLGNALGINAEPYSIEQVFPHRSVNKHRARIVEDRLEIGIQVD